MDSYYKDYTTLELQTEKCLDLYLKKHDVEWKDITPVFENYFSSAGISDKNDPLEKQYQDILNFLENPSKPLPLFNDRKKLFKSWLNFI